MPLSARTVIIYFCGSKVQRLIAQNRRFRFKLEFTAERVYLKMVQLVHGGLVDPSSTLNRDGAKIGSRSHCEGVNCPVMSNCYCCYCKQF